MFRKSEKDGLYPKHIQPPCLRSRYRKYIYILIVDSMQLLSTNASKLKRLHCPTDLTEKSQCQIEKKSIELHQHLNPNQGRGVVPGGVCMEEAAVRGGGLG